MVGGTSAGVMLPALQQDQLFELQLAMFPMAKCAEWPYCKSKLPCPAIALVSRVAGHLQHQHSLTFCDLDMVTMAQRVVGTSACSCPPKHPMTLGPGPLRETYLMDSQIRQTPQQPAVPSCW